MVQKGDTVFVLLDAVLQEVLKGELPPTSLLALVVSKVSQATTLDDDSYMPSMPHNPKYSIANDFVGPACSDRLRLWLCVLLFPLYWCKCLHFLQVQNFDSLTLRAPATS